MKKEGWCQWCQLIYFLSQPQNWERRQSQLTNSFGKALNHQLDKDIIKKKSSLPRQVPRVIPLVWQMEWVAGLTMAGSSVNL